MSYADGHITGNAEILDIQRAIGAGGGGDLGTLCRHANVNMWSKYKPVRSPVKDTVTGQWNATQHRWNLPGDTGVQAASWWQDTGTEGSPGSFATLHGSCGLQFEVFQDLGSTTIPGTFLYRLIAGSLPWTYVRPNGSPSNWYRQTDFSGYYHPALPPLGALGNDGGVIPAETTPQGYRKITLTFDTNADDDMSLMLKHFKVGSKPLTEFYLGIVLYRGQGDYRIVTGVDPIGDEGDGASAEFLIGYDDIGRWKIFPFLSLWQITVDGTLQAGTYLSAGWAGDSSTPGGTEINIRPQGNYIQVTVDAVWTDPDRTNHPVIAVTDVTVVNENSSQLSVGSVTVYLMSKTSSQAYAEGSTISSWTYSTAFTVPARSYATLPPSEQKTYTNSITGESVDLSVVREFTLPREQPYDQTLEYYVTARIPDITMDNTYQELDSLFPNM